MGNNQKDFSQKNAQQGTDKKNQPYEGSKQWSRKNDDDQGKNKDMGRNDDVNRDSNLSDDEDADRQ